MKSSRAIASFCIVVGLVSGTALAVEIDTVRVGNPGNAGELSGTGVGGYGPDRVCGAVGYEYRIGKYEVTAGQYCDFLNAVAKADAYGLYHSLMGSEAYGHGCRIIQTGTSGTFSYKVAPEWANRPVNFVNWGDAARFANWMHNGQPSGAQDLSTTEDGSYYINGATSNLSFLAVTRKESATWVIPTEDEWYKAAYHKDDGATGHFWAYPTGTNRTPSNLVTDPDPGNNGNFSSNSSWCIGSPYYRTEVGEFENSASPYGTFDQGGNLYEWNEALIGSDARGIRGGAYGNNFISRISPLWAGNRNAWGASGDNPQIGFRLAYIPEPATLVLLLFGGLTVTRRTRPQASC